MTENDIDDAKYRHGEDAVIKQVGETIFVFDYLDNYVTIYRTLGRVAIPIEDLENIASYLTGSKPSQLP